MRFPEEDDLVVPQEVDDFFGDGGAFEGNTVSFHHGRQFGCGYVGNRGTAEHHKRAE